MDEENRIEKYWRMWPKSCDFSWKGEGGGEGGYTRAIYLQQLFFSDTSHLRSKSSRLMSHFVNRLLIL